MSNAQIDDWAGLHRSVTRMCEGLRRYGYDAEADYLMSELTVQRMTGDGCLREYPLDEDEMGSTPVAWMVMSFITWARSAQGGDRWADIYSDLKRKEEHHELA